MFCLSVPVYLFRLTFSTNVKDFWNLHLSTIPGKYVLSSPDLRLNGTMINPNDQNGEILVEILKI